ncbi:MULTISPECIES: hypothetical protein [Deinococcus]|uniref:hypothetical protein n=1 Tax=Deinococcus TaxID=1298 RepID=UPI00048912DB|nr:MULTISPECIES: hypothetical protein [Deinococcus]KEF35577.1 hypothetical protein RDMS_00845 [Deinococcus sp. RL]
MTPAPGSPDVILSPDDRARLDPVFMGVVLDVQGQVQQTQPQREGTLAAMFHREQMGEALQGCAMLIAGWNENRVDGAGIDRAARALRGLHLAELAERVERLRQIADA